MLLVDTSVWIDHLRSGEERLIRLLEYGEVVVHPFVIGELACGNLRNRQEILSLLADLPRVESVSHDEVMFFIGRHALHGRGLGFVDLNLLASCAVEGIGLWSKDVRLMKAARELGLAGRQQDRCGVRAAGGITTIFGYPPPGGQAGDATRVCRGFARYGAELANCG